MREIELSQGYKALVDDEDFERVSQFKWCVQVQHRSDGTVKNVYASRNVYKEDGMRTSQRLSRFIVNVTDPRYEVDHRDHNTLNNQKYNLRITKGQNQQNQRLSRANTSGFKGVSWDKPLKKWKAQIQTQRNYEPKCTHLGFFADKLDAARAYNKAALEHFGEFAHLNVIPEESRSK